jgi:hypothetical protein
MAFNSDSSFKVFTSKEFLDSGRYVYNENQLTVFGKNDTTVLTLKKPSDSTLLLSSIKDSIHYSLHKMK